MQFFLDAFSILDPKTFESQVRRSIDLSHNRAKQKMVHEKKRKFKLSN